MEPRKENLYQSVVNPTSASGILAKTAIQVFDPTGISSYPDVYEAGKTFYNNPTWSNVGELGLQTLGALPLIGKLTLPIKLAKGVSKLEKASKAASNVNKAIDTLPELLPLTRNFASKIQNVTSVAPKLLYNGVKSNNVYRDYNKIKGINLGSDVINTSGSIVDLSELLKLKNPMFQNKLIPRNKKGGSSKNWIQKAVNPKHKGYCTPMTKSTCTPKRKALARTFKKMAKARKHENGGLLDFIQPLIDNFKSGGKLK